MNSHTPSKKQNSGLSSHVFTRVLRWVGSLHFAVALIIVLSILLIAATVMESTQGTEQAQKFFYRAGWFDLFLALLALNILCATLVRMPFKRRHTAFLLTHVGILLILGGSLQARLWGTDGRISLFEGEKDDRIALGSYELALSDADGNLRGFALPPRGNRTFSPIPTKDIRIRVDHFLNNAQVETSLEEGPAGTPPNAAIQLTFLGSGHAGKETVWLSERHPFNPHPRRTMIAHELITLEENVSKAVAPEKVLSPTLNITSETTGENILINLNQPGNSPVLLKKSGISLHNIRYFPDARVSHDGFTSVSEEPRNPAVEFEAENAEGVRERIYQFAFFPDFGSSHAALAKKGLPLKALLIMPEGIQSGVGTAPVPAIRLYHEEGRWSLVRPGDQPAETLSAGMTVPAWGGGSLRVDALLTHAIPAIHVVPAERGRDGLPAVLINAQEDGKTLFEGWLHSGKPRTLKAPDAAYEIGITPATVKLPFSIELLDFRKTDYPGTNRPQAFESDVAVRDEANAVELRQTISMNQPLDYLGYRVFQTSYGSDPHQGETSIFTVAKNPGITLLYWGSVIMFVGIVMIFFFKTGKTQKKSRTSSSESETS